MINQKIYEAIRKDDAESVQQLLANKEIDIN